MELKFHGSYSISDILPTDKAAYVEHFKEKQIYDQTLNIPFPYGTSDADWWVNQVSEETIKQGRSVNWSIRNKDGYVVGGIGFHGLQLGKNHKAEIGYWLAKPYWGKGIMSEAVKLVSDYGFNEFGLERITAHVFQFNIGSARVLEKAGYLCEGHLRRHYKKDEKIFDGKIYAKIKSDLQVIPQEVARPIFIKHYSEIQKPDERHYPGSEELMCIGSSFGSEFGLKKLGIHHELLPSGRRTSWPHSEQDEEEFVYVIEGNPDAWINGYLHRLKPGDGVGLPCGTGISHTFINNTELPVRLIVVGEKSKPESKIYYPINPSRRVQCKDSWWHDVPRHNNGPHDGLPDKLRTTSASPPLNFTGEVIEESLSNASILDLLRPYQIKHRTAAMPNEKIKFWNIYRYCIDEPTLENLKGEIETAINDGGWYIHFYGDVGNKMYVFFKEKHFIISKNKDETWIPMIDYGESIGVGRRWTETIPVQFMI